MDDILLTISNLATTCKLILIHLQLRQSRLIGEGLVE